MRLCLALRLGQLTQFLPPGVAASAVCVVAGCEAWVATGWGGAWTVVGASSASDAQAANINAAQAMGRTFDIMV